MTGGEDKPVAVEPAGIRRINLEGFPEKHGTDVGGAEGKAEVARLAGGDGVDGKAAGIAGGELEECVVHKIKVSEETEGDALASLHKAHFRQKQAESYGMRHASRADRLTSRLLLGQTVECAKPPDQLPTINGDDFATREEIPKD